MKPVAHAHKNLGSPLMAAKRLRCRFSTSCPWMKRPPRSYSGVDLLERQFLRAEERAEAPSEGAGVVVEKERAGGGEGGLEREGELAEDAPDLAAGGGHVVAEAGGQVGLQLRERGRGGG